MNILIWLAVSGPIGWAASVLMGTDGRQGIVLNVVVGIVGAVFLLAIARLFGHSASLQLN